MGMQLLSFDRFLESELVLTHLVVEELRTHAMLLTVQMAQLRMVLLLLLLHLRVMLALEQMTPEAMTDRHHRVLAV